VRSAFLRFFTWISAHFLVHRVRIRVCLFLFNVGRPRSMEKGRSRAAKTAFDRRNDRTIGRRLSMAAIFATPYRSVPFSCCGYFLRRNSMLPALQAGLRSWRSDNASRATRGSSSYGSFRRVVTAQFVSLPPLSRGFCPALSLLRSSRRRRDKRRCIVSAIIRVHAPKVWLDLEKRRYEDSFAPSLPLFLVAFQMARTTNRPSWIGVLLAIIAAN